MVINFIDPLGSEVHHFSTNRRSVAARLGSQERVDLSVQALARTEPITTLAERHRVSRKFVYHQKARASEALGEAFESPSQEEERVLFHLPVTPARIRQMVLGLTLTCHSSFRGVMELLDGLFDYRDLRACCSNLS